MATVKVAEEVKLGDQVIEGKTKVVYKLPNHPGYVLVQSKDRITAGDGVRAHDLEGKAAVSNLTNARVFSYLNVAGLQTHFVEPHGETAFIARHCAMVPIEWVTRRIATGSFLKRHPGVKEGYRFNPPKQETFFKDDANHDPQWSTEQLIAASLDVGGVRIGRDEVEYMSRYTVTIFEILEKAWASMNCALVDMKVEFGVDLETKEIILADVIDSDSWRLWPHGDKRLMKDKQVYRDLKEVTPEALNQVKSNFKWIAEKVENFVVKPNGYVAILMGSSSDMDHCKKIKLHCEKFGIPCDLRVTSAHKGTSETLHIVAEYEGMGVPIIFIAVAGRSNGLGPVLSGNTAFPVINCPPVTADFNNDVWSSLRLPSGLGCSTVYSPEAAAKCAAHMLGLNDHLIWSKLRVKQLLHWYELNKADRNSRQDQ